MVAAAVFEVHDVITSISQVTLHADLNSTHFHLLADVSVLCVSGS